MKVSSFDLLEQARAAGCILTVLPGGQLNIQIPKKQPITDELRQKLAEHKLELMFRLHQEKYPDMPEHKTWAMAWMDTCAPMLDVQMEISTAEGKALESTSLIGVHPSSYGTHVQAAWGLCVDVGDAAWSLGFELTEATKKYAPQITAGLPQYGLEGVLKPFLRRWWAAYQERRRLEDKNRLAQGPWLRGEVKARPTAVADYDAQYQECLKWAQVVLVVEREGGNWPYIDPLRWAGLFEEILADSMEVANA